MNSSSAVVYNDLFLKHDEHSHPEHAGRLIAIVDEIKKENLWNELIHINTRPASIDELCLCHSEEYVKRLKLFCENGGGYLDPDTYANKFSFDAASLAVGGLLELTQAVIDGKVKNGFALVRPPGHHALRNNAMGFCLFGNVSIAAKWALQQNGIHKAAVVDFDVHHGNGTQAMVEDDPDILFISTHQYPCYPGTGNIHETGKNNAEGTIINIPLQPSVGDSGFKLIYDEIVILSLSEYKPDIIFVSAGYDAHREDPLANLELSTEGFKWISDKLVNAASELCNSKIVFTLEGGYNLKALSEGVSNSIKSLMGYSAISKYFGQSQNNEPDISKIILELRKIHQL